MNIITKLNKLKFDTFLKMYIGVNIFNFSINAVSNYIWPTRYLSSTARTITGVVGLVIIIPLVMWWYKKIKNGSETAFKIFKWLFIASFVILPFSHFQNYQTAKTINDFSSYNPGNILTQIIGITFYIFSYVYITNYWKRNYQDKKK